MTREVCENPRVVYYWMTCDERDNTPNLQTEYRQWKTNGYKVCTFISGEGSLVELTKDLLKYNKEVAARNNAT